MDYFLMDYDFCNDIIWYPVFRIENFLSNEIENPGMDSSNTEVSTHFIELKTDHNLVTADNGGYMLAKIYLYLFLSVSISFIKFSV